MRFLRFSWVVTRTLVAVAALMVTAGAATAQKIAYVDTRYILDKLPEYAAAEKEIDLISQKWQKELDGTYAQIEQLYQKYRAEEVLMTDAIKRERQDEILQKEKEAKEYQRKRFGYEGDVFKQREEKVKPIQDRVFAAVEVLAKERKLDFVFDKAGAVVMLYTSSAYDLSDEVLAKLGVSSSGR